MEIVVKNGGPRYTGSTVPYVSEDPFRVRGRISTFKDASAWTKNFFSPFADQDSKIGSFSWIEFIYRISTLRES